MTSSGSVGSRIERLDWDGLGRMLDEQGFAVTEPVLGAGECEELACLFDSDRFRSTVDMARHRFGDGRYRYFAHPLPEPIEAARVAFYGRLAPIATAGPGSCRATTRPSRRRTRSSSSAVARPGRNGPRR